MPRQNKILSSDNKDYIDNQLINGVPYRQLSEALQEMGESISHTALSEYHKRYLNGETNKVSVPDLPPLEFDESILEISSDGELKNTMEQSSTSLQVLYLRQCKIVESLQARYIRGEGRFPVQEVKALKTFKELLDNSKISNQI